MRIDPSDEAHHAAYQDGTEDTIEMFAYSELMHNGPQRQHSQRGTKVPNALNPDHHKRYSYRSTNIKRRRDPESERLELVVKKNRTTTNQTVRNDLVQRAIDQDEARWQAIHEVLLTCDSLRSSCAVAHYAIFGYLHVVKYDS
jgi:hypothetical protein